MFCVSLCEWAALCRVLHTQVCALAPLIVFNSTCCLTIWGQTLRASLTGAEPTTDLSLATPLKTAGFVPFFLTRNTFIKTRNRRISLWPHKRETFQTRTSASPQHQAQVKRASVEQQWTAVWWDAVRLYISKTNFPVLSAVTVLTAHTLQLYANIRRTLFILIINNARKKLWAYKVLSSVKSWNYQKGN